MKRYTLEDIQDTHIELTDFCNMSCDYCPLSLPEEQEKRKKMSVFPKDLFIKVVDYLAELPNLKTVCLTELNEFFLTPHLTTFYLPALKERGLGYKALTNGTIFPKDADYYPTNPPDILAVGVQTITEEQYLNCNRWRETSPNRGMSFDTYIEGVARVIKFFYEKCPKTLISIEIATNTSQSLRNQILGNSYHEYIPTENAQMEHVPGFVATLSELTGVAAPMGARGKKRYSFQEIVASSVDKRINYGLKAFSEKNNFYDKIPTSKPPVCFVKQVTITGDGNVRYCSFDYRGGTKFGNVRTDSMRDIYAKYVEHMNTIRTVGSPWECCKNCFGYSTQRQKYATEILRPPYRAVRSLFTK